MRFKDHFSGHAALYARSRPDYPDALFDWLAARAPGRELAWDCATGNGQAARKLAGRFARVIASDASPEQIFMAASAPGVEFRAMRAEKPDLPDESVDLITVAQALHWFDLPAFYAQARRVLKPGGLLACWGYELMEITPEVDAVVLKLYAETLGPHWPPERALLESGYRTLDFPFAEETPPELAMTAEWDLERVCEYLGSWSAVRRYMDAHRGADPVAAARRALAEAWGDPARERTVTWPLAYRIGRV